MGTHEFLYELDGEEDVDHTVVLEDYIRRCLSMLTSDQDYKKDTLNITNNRYSHGN